VTEPSGPAWCELFATSSAIEDLAEPFRSSVQAFLAACNRAPIAIHIAATRRPAERAYLMHWAWRIAAEAANPLDIPKMDGVDIAWAHYDKARYFDYHASRGAAQEMVRGYGIAYRPSLTSNHILGRAIDMRLSWDGAVAVEAKDGVFHRLGICKLPVDEALIAVAATYGVKKLRSDAPHWSEDGH
jgi:hypothetical protein